MKKKRFRWWCYCKTCKKWREDNKELAEEYKKEAIKENKDKGEDNG